MSDSPPKRRILYVVGAQCSGKTTLIEGIRQRLKQQYQDESYEPPIIKEVAREVLPRLGLTGTEVLASKGRTMDAQTAILRAQREAELGRSADSWYVADRSAIDALMFAKAGAGTQAEEYLMRLDDWKQLWPRLKSALIILCEPVQDWLKPDGLRYVPPFEQLLEFHQFFIAFMEEHKLDYKLVRQEWRTEKERVDFVMEHWDRV